MNSPSRSTAGASSSAASSHSLSRNRVSPRGRAIRGAGSATVAAVALPASPEMTRFTRDPLAWRAVAASPLVDLLELALGPLHGVLGLRALDGLGEHVHDDVLRVALGGLGRGRAVGSEHSRLADGPPEHLEGLVHLGPHRVLFPRRGAAHAVALVDHEP